MDENDKILRDAKLDEWIPLTFSRDIQGRSYEYAVSSGAPPSGIERMDRPYGSIERRTIEAFPFQDAMNNLAFWWKRVK